MAGDCVDAANACCARRRTGRRTRVIFGVDIASMLLGGLAAGMVLFIVSVGLSVTMGLMGFVNLAHGGFAMLGGYVIVLAMPTRASPSCRRWRSASSSPPAVSVVFERLLYSRLYRAPELDQVLFTIGLVFIMIAAVTLARRAREPAAARCRRGCRARSISASCTYRTYSIVPDRGRHRDRARRSGSASSAPAWARRSAPRSTTAAWRNRSASTSTGCSPSPSPSAAAWRRSAAASAPSSSASIRNIR